MPEPQRKTARQKAAQRKAAAYLTLRDAARWLDVGYEALRYRLRHGDVPGAYKAEGVSGKPWRVPERWVRDQLADEERAQEERAAHLDQRRDEEW